jgi:hypothetical protein
MWKDIGPTIIATRAATFDQLTNQYLAEAPDATVLHVGCGMDSRVFRVDPPASVQWFDVDYPDVIDLRRQLFPHARNLSKYPKNDAFFCYFHSFVLACSEVLSRGNLPRSAFLRDQ